MTKAVNTLKAESNRLADLAEVIQAEAPRAAQALLNAANALEDEILKTPPTTIAGVQALLADLFDEAEAWLAFDGAENYPWFDVWLGVSAACEACREMLPRDNPVLASLQFSQAAAFCDNYGAFDTAWQLRSLIKGLSHLQETARATTPSLHSILDVMGRPALKLVSPVREAVA
ncbi:hypothetical protein FHS85_000026 [Rhodoligotrophos appendicifer]|uniref:hypothetical protein n=1 Tax=Rhodoligotrophos appendicifer TaxID=987056 RepID=UPI00117C5FE9|nr:hypothetical protein [Rhodoligotrophos appendicifer]